MLAGGAQTQTSCAILDVQPYPGQLHRACWHDPHPYSRAQGLAGHSTPVLRQLAAGHKHSTGCKQESAKHLWCKASKHLWCKMKHRERELGIGRKYGSSGQTRSSLWSNIYQMRSNIDQRMVGSIWEEWWQVRSSGRETRHCPRWPICGRKICSVRAREGGRTVGSDTATGQTEGDWRRRLVKAKAQRLLSETPKFKISEGFWKSDRQKAQNE